MSPGLNVMAARALSSSCFADLLATSNLCVLDVRPFLQYNKGHVQNAINVPLSALMLRRVARNGLDEYISSDVKDSLSRASTVVLYDAETEDIEQHSSPKCPLRIMVEALQSAAMSVYFLCGGFSSFENAYPSLCKLAPLSSCRTDGSTGLKFQGAKVPASAPIGSFTGMGHPLKLATVPSKVVLSLGLPSFCRESSVTSPRDSEPQESTDPAELAPHLLLGSIHHASDRNVINKAGITAVLNVSNQCKNYFSDDLTYKQIPVDDTLCSSLKPYFEEAAEFIESVKQSNGRVLVHCVGGVSRSPTICIAYFVLKGLMTVDEAYKFIKSRRPVMGPNFSFMGELRMLEDQLRAACAQSCATAGEGPHSLPGTPASV